MSKRKNRISKNPAGGRKKDREINRLSRALEAERRKSAALEREVTALKRRLQASPHTPSLRRRRRTKREMLLLGDAGRRAQHYRKSSFVRYLWESVMDSIPVQVVTKLVLYLRRVQVVRMIATVLLATGAALLVAILSATLLPFFFFGTGVLSILALIRSRRMNRLLKRALNGRRVRVFIPPRGGALSKDSFFIRNARAMAEEGVAVIVVTPYLISTRGLGGHGGFFTARREADGLYLVRRHYYFFLRRHVLDSLDRPITVVY